MASVSVQRVSGEPVWLAVADEETVDELRDRLADIWNLRSATRLRIMNGTNISPGCQRVLDAGTTFSAVLQTECPQCRSNLDISLFWPSTGSYEEEQQFRRVSLSLSTRRRLERQGARWLWEAGSQEPSAGGGPAFGFDHDPDDDDMLGFLDDLSSNGSDEEELYSEYENEGYDVGEDERCDEDVEGLLPQKAHTGQYDRSYTRCGGGAGSRRSTRCNKCLAETTSLALKIEQVICTKTYFQGLDTSFPNLQRLLINDTGDGPTGVPYLDPIARLSNLRMLDLWMPGATNHDPGEIQILGSLTGLTHLYILGMRHVYVADLKKLLEPLLNLEVLLMLNGAVDGNSEDAIDLSRHAFLQKLCLDGSIWSPPDAAPSHREPALLLPAGLRDISIPLDSFSHRKGAWIDRLLKTHQHFFEYYRDRGQHIGDRHQSWADKKLQAYKSSFADA